MEMRDQSLSLADGHFGHFAELVVDFGWVDIAGFRDELRYYDVSFHLFDFGVEKKDRSDSAVCLARGLALRRTAQTQIYGNSSICADRYCDSGVRILSLF